MSKVRAPVDAPERMKSCGEQLTGYKKPKYIRFKTELPKTNVGKVLPRELRDEAVRTMSAGKAA